MVQHLSRGLLWTGTQSRLCLCLLPVHKPRVVLRGLHVTNHWCAFIRSHDSHQWLLHARTHSGVQIWLLYIQIIHHSAMSAALFLSQPARSIEFISINSDLNNRARTSAANLARERVCRTSLLGSLSAMNDSCLILSVNVFMISNIRFWRGGGGCWGW